MSQRANQTSLAAKTRQPSISTKLQNLEELTDWFYSEDFSLDQALEKYQAAIQLATEIKQDLSELRNQVEVLQEDFTKS